MLRLDSLALKATLIWSKTLFRRLEESETDDDTKSEVETFWDITTRIIGMEQHGNEAIKMVGILSCFDSQTLSLALPYVNDNGISLLSDYNVIDVELCQCYFTKHTTRITMHSRILIDVIREKNVANKTEMGHLRRCFQILNENHGSGCCNYQHWQSESRYIESIWSNMLNYPELVREFKDDLFRLCYHYLHRCSYKKKDRTIEWKTVELFHEVFGSKDIQATKLRFLKLKVLLKSSRVTARALLQECRRNRPVFEEYIRYWVSCGYQEMRSLDRETVSETWRLEDEILSLVISRKCFSRKLVLESLRFCTSIYNIYKRVGDLDSMLRWFELVGLYQIKLNKTSEILVRFQELRGYILSHLRLILPNNDAISIFGKVYWPLITLWEIVFRSFETKSSQKYRYFNSVLYQELYNMLEICYNILLQISEIEEGVLVVVVGVLFVAELLPDLVLPIVRCLGKLGKFDKILNVTEQCNALVRRVLDKPENCQRYISYIKIYAPTLIQVHLYIFEIVNNKSISTVLKDLLIQNSITATKYLFASCLRIYKNDRFNPLLWSSDDFGKLDSLMLDIIQCYLQLNLFPDLVEFLSECEGMLASEEIIKLCAIIMEKFIPVRKSSNALLVQRIQLTSEKHLETISNVDYESNTKTTVYDNELSKASALKTIELCQALLDKSLMT